MSGWFFEDFEVGDVIETPRRTITESDVVAFAGLSGDYNPIHTDEIFAQDTQYGSRVAHGLLGMAVSSGLVARTGVFEGTALAFLGVEDWQFRGPILLGDTVHVEMEITDKRLSSKGERGILWRRMRLWNQRGEMVQEGTFLLLVRCREESELGGADDA